ncbi:hypothetical protein D3C80_1773050 [compost metagenome]
MRSAAFVGIKSIFSAVQKIPGIKEAGQLRYFLYKGQQLRCCGERRPTVIKVFHTDRNAQRLGIRAHGGNGLLHGLHTLLILHGSRVLLMLLQKARNNQYTRGTCPAGHGQKGNNLFLPFNAAGNVAEIKKSVHAAYP